MEDYSFTVPEETGNRLTKRHIGCMAAVFAAAILVILIPLKAMVPTDWRIFTKSRIETLESEYHMNLSQADPKRYWVPAIAQDTKDCFRFIVDDYSAFMENCFFGEIITAPEPEAANASYAEYECRAYSDGRLILFITFTKKDGRYEADLTSYTE